MNSVKVTAEQIHNRKIFSKIVKTSLILLILIISVLYFFLYIIYQNGRFVISLDKNMSNDKNIFLSEDGTVEGKTTELSIKSLDYMDNISWHWISPDVDTEAVGVHNGTNYIAYTFFVINAGTETVNYWYEIDVDDTIKNVDEAVRIMIYRNGEQKIYAKKNKTTNEAEKDTVSFYSSDIAVLEERKTMNPGESDRFTIVIWLEGDDPDCVNDILGGELKMHMDFTEEHLGGKKK